MPSSRSNLDEARLHHRQELSAMMDGELAADQASFLMRRLEHDACLAGYHRRWQLYGKLMRESPVCQHLRTAAIAHSNRSTDLLSEDWDSDAWPHPHRVRSHWMMRCAQVMVFCLGAFFLRLSEADHAFSPPLLGSAADGKQASQSLAAWSIDQQQPAPRSSSILSSVLPASAQIGLSVSALPSSSQPRSVGYRASPLPARPWPRTRTSEQNTFNADYRTEAWFDQPTPFPARLPSRLFLGMPDRSSEEGDP